MCFLQPIWTEREASIEFLSSGSGSNSTYAPFYPLRVSPRILKPQKSSENLTAPVYLKSAAETESSLDENLTSSCSESEAESEIIGTTKRATNPVRTDNRSLSTPKILKPQKSSKKLKAAVYLNLAAEAESSLDKNLPCSPSESEAESEVIDTIHRKTNPMRTEFIMLVILVL